MTFRPCIDIHNGQVKQIVGASLRDKGDEATENFVAAYDASYYARLYKEHNLKGAHVIMLNSKDSEYYEATKAQALLAISEYKDSLQVGGGIDDKNAKFFIDNGASHVIVTSYVFKDGLIQYENLDALVKAVGKEHIVLDLSAGKKDGGYVIVTDRWQKYSSVNITAELFVELSQYCDEFLVHGIDTEGLKKGPDMDLIKILSDVSSKVNTPITYAGGIANTDHIKMIEELSGGKLNYTIGSALDIFGGSLSFEEICGK